MGLDMYLEAEKYVSGYDFHTDGRQQTYKDLLDLVGAAEFASTDTPSGTVNINVGYWRKANAIHAWFINHCADGVDDCRSIYVGRESLAELLADVQIVLADPSQAAELLPTQSGFFFGSVDYDEWYVSDLNYTKELLTKVLTEVPEDWDFYYRASW